MNFQHLKSRILGIVFVFCLTMLFIPINQVHAQQAVVVLEDIAKTTIARTIDIALSKVSDALTASGIQSLTLKEYVLDAIPWLAKEQLQQQLSAQFVKWLGGQLPGQNGQSPIIKNYSEHYRKILDGVAGEFTFGKELSGLCSEENNFFVRQEVYQYYIESRREEVNQCEPENSEDQVGILEQMFRENAGCNDINCAGYKAKAALTERQAQALANEKQVLDYTKGLEPTRVCKTINDPDGYPRQICEIVNPPSVLPDTASFILGQLPALQLLNMDEFNEVVSSFMSNLTNQAITGITGALGLSGDPNYSANVFGPGGNLSYADALAQDDISQYQSTAQNPIKDTLRTERRYTELQQEILSEIAALEDRLAENEAEFPSCFDLELTDELQKAKADALTNLNISSTTIAILVVLDQQFDNSTDGNTRNAVLNTFISYQSQGLFRSDYENQELEISYIDLEFAKMVDRFKYDTAVERHSCGGDFDYDGVLEEPDET